MKQGQLHLSQMTDCWPRPRSSFLTVLNKFNFIIIITVVSQEINGLSRSWPESSISTTWKNVEEMCTQDSHLFIPLYVYFYLEV